MRAGLFAFGVNRGWPLSRRDYCWGVVEVVLEDGEEGLELELLVELELPTGLEVLLAGWPTRPVLPPLMVCISESGS
jgi:hypothetical protein